jgi:rubrerythrin
MKGQPKVDTLHVTRYPFFRYLSAGVFCGTILFQSYRETGMNKYSIDEVMEMAVQSEKLGYQFYTGMAEKFKKDDGLSKLFMTLASKEKVHEKTFTGLKESVAKQGAEPVQWEEVSNYMRAFVESEFFLGRAKALPSMDHVKTVMEAVRFAIGFEKETLLYFMELRTIVKEKEVVEEVINEEKSHIRWLDTFRAGLAK